MFSNKQRIRKYLIIGLIGSFITVVGEMLQGYAVALDTTNELTMIFSTIETLSIARIGIGATIGALGILMQFYGYYALYLAIEDKETRLAQMYKIGVYIFSIIGSIVHVLMSMMMYVYKINIGNENLIQIVAEFTTWFVLPIVIIFFIFYFLMAVSMFILLVKKDTPFPRWGCILNPLLGKGLINALMMFLPNIALVNGIRFSNMGISSVFILFIFLIHIDCIEDY